MSLGYWKVVQSAHSDGSAITAAAATSALPTSAKCCMGPLVHIGQVFRFRAWGRISCVVTTPGTARFDLRINSTVVFDSLAIPLNTTAQTNVPWELDVLLTARTLGTAANLMGQGRFSSRAVVGSGAAGTSGVGAELLP